MGVFTDYFRATDREAVTHALDQHDGGSPLIAPLHWDGVETKGIDPTVVLGQLVTTAQGVRWTARALRHPLVWPTDPDGDGPWVTELDPAVRDTLAALPDHALRPLADRWSRIDEFHGTTTADDLLPLLSELVALARRARAADDHLYCWTCL